MRRRSDEYAHLYRTQTWRKLRAVKLARDPLCQRCLVDGRGSVAANVAHHKKPHRGDATLFYSLWNLESVCAPCHDSSARREDNTGFSVAVGLDGWPVDPRHPANRVR